MTRSVRFPAPPQARAGSARPGVASYRVPVYRVAVIAQCGVPDELRLALEHAAAMLTRAGHTVAWKSARPQAGSDPFDGALVAGPSTAGGFERVSVILGGRCADDSSPTGSVAISLALAGAKAAHHLLAQGCRQLAVITNPAAGERDQTIVSGFSSAVRDFTGSGQQPVLVEADGTEGGGRLATEWLLSTHSRFDGLFATSHHSAEGAITALRRRGVSMPAGVAVVGYGHLAGSGAAPRLLTTVGVPDEQLGRASARLLVNLIEDRRPDRWQMELPPTLVARRSAPNPPRRRHPALS